MKRLSPEVERRRRLLTRALPLTIVAVVAFILGASAGAPGLAEKAAAKRFAEAWAQHEFAAMYEELNPASKRAIGVAKTSPGDYREAEGSGDAALAGAGLPREGPQLGRRRRRAGAAARSRRSPSAPSTPTSTCPSPKAASPGPLPRLPRAAPRRAPGSRIELAPRAPILAADGTPARRGPGRRPLAPDRQRRDRRHRRSRQPPKRPHFRRSSARASPPYTPVGISGLEKAFNRRLAGKPGGSLLAVAEAARRSPGSSPIAPEGRAPR